jgi:hypothetical protein
MKVKKFYNLGESAWIHGVDFTNNHLKEGTVVKHFRIDYDGFNDEIIYFVVAIPSSIEPLLEIRTWDTMSQDQNGPVGGLRSNNTDIAVDKKVLSKVGLTLNHSDQPELGLEFEEELDPTPEQIHAAMERSQQTAVLPPLVLKEHRPNKPRRYNKKPRKP